MAIRVSTSQTYMQGTNVILDNQSKVSSTQLQLSSGKRILQPSDDPIGTSVAMNLKQQLDTTKQYLENGQSVKTRLDLQESALDSTTSILQRVRDLALKGANSTLNYQDRTAIAIEIEKRAQELLGLANSQESSGDYIFAGFKTNVKPFDRDGSGKVTYNGDQGVQLVNVNSTVQVEKGNSGDAVFMNIPTGNGSFVSTANAANTGTGIIGNAVLIGPPPANSNFSLVFSAGGPTGIQYQVMDHTNTPVGGPQSFSENNPIQYNGITVSISGAPAAGDQFSIAPSASQDIFATLNQIVTALKLPSDSAPELATFRNAINLGIQNIDQASQHIDNVRASIGSRLNVVESEGDINESLLVQSKSALSLVEDLDYASAITELNKRMLALQAAQQSFVKVQNLSLFEFL